MPLKTLGPIGPRAVGERVNSAPSLQTILELCIPEKELAKTRSQI